MPDFRSLPADARERVAALDIRRSVLVQAPAGSGKTDLLTRRFLALLATVNEPEEILAITFTRAATAEMRARILQDLEAAARDGQSSPAGASDRLEMARAALARSQSCGWQLLEQPQRLAIETIDSLCLRIAHDRPLLARLGGKLQPTEEAAPLYALAARRTLEQLGQSDSTLTEALAHLLDLRDNRLADCESLLGQMLAVRDQWQHAFPLSGGMTEDDWETARTHLQGPFQRENRRVLAEAHRLLEGEPLLRSELLALAQYACAHGNERVALLAGVTELSASMPIEHWKSLCDLVVKEDGDWFRIVDKRHGFPSGPGAQEKKRREAMLFLLGRLRQMPQLLAALCEVRNLPPPRYSEAQWTTLRHVLTVLRRAIAELRIVFAENDAVDFTEIALAAHAVLEEAPERAAELAGNIRHLLVDEFQDTSRRQHDLIARLVASWEGCEPAEAPRTVFLVGDPMQSIYMFRQAEVELFAHVRERGIGPEENRTPCDPVQLSVNFRSHAGLTEPLNTIFAAIDAEPGPPGAASVSFAEAVASEPAPPVRALHVHPRLIPCIGSSPRPEEVEAARREEAREILTVLEQHLPRIQEAQRSGAEYRVAVLVRARTHLAELVPLLRERGMPFRAVEIERLSERQELRDLLALTRALLHPMDRVAWFSVLRAPWCGLTLTDLHGLAGSDDRSARDLAVPELIARNAARLTADGQRRVARTAAVLGRALDLRWNLAESPSFASWIERTWRTLGGPACLDAAGYENAQVFFSLLDTLSPDGLVASTSAFEGRLERLFAQPDPTVTERCGIQLMTIHKAKGLGFDVVLVPGLDRKSPGDAQPLICSLERRNPFNLAEDEFLVAPIGARGDETDPLYAWVNRQRKVRFDEERKRLFYVACTRARRELHLLGSALAAASGVRVRHQDSLLATAWPALHQEFEELLTAEAGGEPARVLSFPAPGIVEELAAVAEPLAGPRRLGLEKEPLPPEENVPFSGANGGAAVADLSGAAEFRRPQGSRVARVTGTAVHALLQRLGPELFAASAEEIRARAAALLRGSALAGAVLESATETATKLLLACAADPVCRWILGPHSAAASETSWSGYPSGFVQDSRLRTVRPDRVFRAGPRPPGPKQGGAEEAADCLWVIDYKTGAPSSADREAFVLEQRALYARQLEEYAGALRAMYGAETPVRLGLYYPAIAYLDWWEGENGRNERRVEAGIRTG